MPSLPTQRTLACLRAQGADAAIVERFNPHVGPHGIRQDLFGIIDILAIDPYRKGAGLVGIQACAGAGGDVARRLAKMRDPDHMPVAVRWLQAPGRLEIWGWAKRVRKTVSRKAKNPTRIVYELRRIVVTLAVLNGAEPLQTCDPCLDSLTP